MPSTPRRRRGLLLVAVTLVAAVVTGTVLWSVDEPEPPLPAPRSAQIDVLDGEHGQQRVLIDATLYPPTRTPAPAVVLTHGFGKDKESVSGQARALARRGFTVLTYSSRGSGNSTGRIALNSPEYEVADARQIIDWLSRQPEVRRDGDRDPRVGVTGESYGGALSLLLAGTDHRVDAIAPALTYNDLEQALLPNGATAPAAGNKTPAHGADGQQGVFKRAWAGRLFSAGTTSSRWPRGDSNQRSRDGSPASSICGRFTQEVCAAYNEIARTGKAGPRARELLDSVSPKSVTHNITAPTLLVQGERDTLFGLDQADANARQIAASGTRVKTLWYAGGHDSDPPPPRVRAEVAEWFAFHLGGVAPTPDPGTGFSYDIAGERRRGGEVPVRTVTAPTYPGVRSEPTARFDLSLRGPSTTITNPPGGIPAATSSLPGVSNSELSRESLASDWPGQVARFSSQATDHRLVISGVPHTRLTVAAPPNAPNTDTAVLFAKLYDVGPEGRKLLGDSVSPLRVPDLPRTGEPREVEVALPGMVHSMRPGHRLELAVSTTDHAYDTPEAAAVYRVGLGSDHAVSMPSVPGRDTGDTIPAAPLLGIGGIGLLWLVIWGAAAMRRRSGTDADPDLADTPLVLSGVSKSFARDTAAVRDASLHVERGQIVGLLGPNGAGKTTTLRMLLGLVRPSGGTLRIFGHHVVPGAPVLTRVGSLVESPGFVPYLSGVDNLRTYWASTGRPLADAHLDEVLRIAGLTESQLRRKVRTYTQGMRQRLAIAQAMLGLPELLVLDEPANRLDPPRIRALRGILQRYADSGRSILLSSHLLPEVEQTCTHVVVMHQGELVTSGRVEDLVATHSEVTFHVDDPESAADALYRLEGLGKVETGSETVHAELGRHSPAVAVNTLVAAGIAVTGMRPRQRLEDAFLLLVGEERS